MEPENNQPVQSVHISSLSQLKKVTPLSKYLALGLFIVLPFIGGLVGYTYAPEKVVEVLVPNTIEKSTQTQQEQTSLTPVAVIPEGLSIQSINDDGSYPVASIYYSENGKPQYLGQSMGCNAVEVDTFDIADLKEQTLKAFVNKEEGINYVKNWSVEEAIQCYYAGGGHRFVLINQGDDTKISKAIYVSTMDEIVGSGAWDIVLLTENATYTYPSTPLVLLQDFVEGNIDTSLLEKYMKVMINLY
jgi:hypothetical protein